MTEKFLQYIWQHKLFYSAKTYVSNTGSLIEIIDTGKINYDAGPDFFNAKVKIDDTVWAGNIEIHVNASDWKKHHHESDMAYNNVILHVVHNPNSKTLNTFNKEVPVIQIEFPEKYYKNYYSLLNHKGWISCEHKLGQVDEFYISAWLENLLIEKIQKKADGIHDILAQNKNNWEETFYIFLGRNFGFNLNSDPFEQLARYTPLKTLAQHKNNLLQVEALLFGQAGFLNEELDDDYFMILKKEYQHLKTKFNLVGIEKYMWKFLRLRPSNFPTVRLAQFANLIYKSSALFSKILETEKLEDLFKLFDVETSPYWKNHYQFEKSSMAKNKNLGTKSIDLIIINTVVPFLVIYGKEKNIDKYQQRAFLFLEQLKPEENSITKNWKSLGIPVENAYRSQALVFLKKQYCENGECLRCNIGNKVISY